MDRGDLLPRLLRKLGLILLAIAAGAMGGWLAEWPAALLSMRLTGAGYTGTEPHWDPGWASFSATYHGAPFGALLGVTGYLLFLRSLPGRRVIRSVPVLFAVTLTVAVVSSIFGAFGRLVLTAAAFFLACWCVAEPETTQRAALHPEARPADP